GPWTGRRRERRDCAGAPRAALRARRDWLRRVRTDPIRPPWRSRCAMKDRALLLAGLAALALGLLGLVLGSCELPSSTFFGLSRSSASAQVTPPWQARATGEVKEFALTVDRIGWELAAGKTVQ